MGCKTKRQDKGCLQPNEHLGTPLLSSPQSACKLNQTCGDVVQLVGLNDRFVLSTTPAPTSFIIAGDDAMTTFWNSYKTYISITTIATTNITPTITTTTITITTSTTTTAKVPVRPEKSSSRSIVLPEENNGF